MTSSPEPLVRDTQPDIAVTSLQDVLRARRAVRSYAPRPVDHATLRALLDAAVLAPSAMNRQPWRFAIVQNRAQLARYSDVAKELALSRMHADEKASHYAEELRNPAFCIFYDAGALVVIGVEKPDPWADADCWLAAGNLMLAAADLGLGSCPIGFAMPALNTPTIKAEIGLPAPGAAIAAVIVGHPRGATAPIRRAPPRIVSWSR